MDHDTTPEASATNVVLTGGPGPWAFNSASVGPCILVRLTMLARNRRSPATASRTVISDSRPSGMIASVTKMIDEYHKIRSARSF